MHAEALTHIYGLLDSVSSPVHSLGLHPGYFHHYRMMYGGGLNFNVRSDCGTGPLSVQKGCRISDSAELVVSFAQSRYRFALFGENRSVFWFEIRLEGLPGFSLSLDPTCRHAHSTLEHMLLRCVGKRIGRGRDQSIIGFSVRVSVRRWIPARSTMADSADGLCADCVSRCGTGVLRLVSGCVRGCLH